MEGSQGQELSETLRSATSTAAKAVSSGGLLRTSSPGVGVPLLPARALFASCMHHVVARNPSLCAPPHVSVCELCCHCGLLSDRVGSAFGSRLPQCRPGARHGDAAWLGGTCMSSVVYRRLKRTNTQDSAFASGPNALRTARRRPAQPPEINETRLRHRAGCGPAWCRPIGLADASEPSTAPDTPAVPCLRGCRRR